LQRVFVWGRIEIAMMKKIFIFVFLFVTSFISEIKADTIYLKNGRSMEGLITREDEERVELDIGIGKVTFTRSDIERISKSSRDESISIRQEWQKQERLQEEERLKIKQELDKHAQEGEEQPKEALSSKPIEGIDFINTDNYANTRLEFYYYIPSGVIENKNKPYPLLLCIPGLSGSGEDFVQPIFKEFANKEGFVIVAPSFIWDEKNWDSQRSYQFPSVWSGEALIRIINKLKDKQGILLSKFYLFGVSAGAQFSLRFAIWRPELCAACAAHGSGGTVTPEEKIGVKFYVSVGKEDRSRIAKSEWFYNSAKKLGIDVIYRQYEGGHTFSNLQIEDSLSFFKNVKESANR
jgi:predicted esterase